MPGQAWIDQGPIFTDSSGGRLRPQNLLERSFVPLLVRAGLPRVGSTTCATCRHAAR